MSLDESIDALLSSKDPASVDLLSASPTVEGKLETALLKIGRMEDMDNQLRSQLEKIITQHNQLSAEKAAGDIEIQHLQAQVELLEADSAGRHSGGSTPGTPRETMDSLQANNARLQDQVESATHEISQLQAQLHHSHRHMCPQQRQDTFSSFDACMESQLHAQISKSEYEVARQAAQILELQGELTKVQVSFDRSAQRQTEANAQLTRQESIVSRHATTNTHLQGQLQEAQITAASQQTRITQLESKLIDRTNSQLKAQEQCERLEGEAQLLQELAVKRHSELQLLQAQLDESTAASAAAADAKLHLQEQLQGQQGEQSQLKKKYEQAMEGLQASVSASASKQESLQAEVHSTKAQAAEQHAQLHAQHDEIQSLKEKLESAVTDRAASQASLAELSVSSRSQLAEHHDSVKKLQQQLADAQTELSELQSDRAKHARLKEVPTEAASKHRQEVSDLQAQLRQAEEEVASLADTRTHLQQQLGERTIVLGQKAHQIAHLTAQLNEVGALSSSSPSSGKGTDTQQPLSPAPQSQDGQKSSASASNSPVPTPMQSVPAAHKETSDAAQALSTKGGTAAESSDSPITPLQADPSYPQRHTYTPSESGPSTGANPSTGPESIAKHAQQGTRGDSGGQTQPPLQGRFDQLNKHVADSVDDSNSSLSVSEQSPRQERSAVATAENGGTGGHVQAQLSPPQSCPSTPASQIGTTHGSDDAYRSVTHVNSCFANSDDEGKNDDILSSKSDQLLRDDDETNAAATVERTDEEEKLQSRRHDLAVVPQTQAVADAQKAKSHACHLEQRLAECQCTLDTVTQRAISADVDLKAALATLSDAEKVMSFAVRRQQAAELVSVISGCIAAFIMAAATTVYWLH